MKQIKIHRDFEIPYNFDIKLIDGILMFDNEYKSNCNCFYIPPRGTDYQSILRQQELNNYSKAEYEFHINYINRKMPNKLQLLLQRQHQIMNAETLKYYINLGFKNFCVGTYEQACIIKEINSDFHIVGSITMNIDENKIKPEYKDVFDDFVLHFHYCRDLEGIKKLPKDFSYLLLVNSLCNVHCDGYRHWNMDINNGMEECPGTYPLIINKWEHAINIRPMDLKFFDPYIKTYKLQDRAWTTEAILRDFILYTTDYEMYPNINYDENIYKRSK